VFALPYTWAILAGSRAAHDPRLVIVARSLGAGPIRTWWAVTFPLLMRSTLVAVAIAFSVSAALYLPTVFAGAGRIITVATEAASAAASGNLRVAAINAAAQATAPVIVLALATFVARAVFRNRQGVPS
jgi:putative thiamine transport system permease protein